MLVHAIPGTVALFQTSSQLDADRMLSPHILCTHPTLLYSHIYVLALHLGRHRPEWPVLLLAFLTPCPPCAFHFHALSVPCNRQALKPK